MTIALTFAWLTLHVDICRRFASERHIRFGLPSNGEATVAKNRMHDSRKLVLAFSSKPTKSEFVNIHISF